VPSGNWVWRSPTSASHCPTSDTAPSTPPGSSRTRSARSTPLARPTTRGRRDEVAEWAWLDPVELRSAVAAAPFAFSPWLGWQLAAWQGDERYRHLQVSVNVSARQFHHAGFVEQVLGVLEQTGAPAQRLKLELTESLLITNVEDVVTKMGALKARGVCFSLDDFGTGYSSLAYLKRLPLDQLKIDQSFVRDVLTDPNDATIACTIITLARSLGLDVVAEGVETVKGVYRLARNIKSPCR